MEDILDCPQIVHRSHDAIPTTGPVLNGWSLTWRGDDPYVTVGDAAPVIALRFDPADLPGLGRETSPYRLHELGRPASPVHQRGERLYVLLDA